MIIWSSKFEEIIINPHLIPIAETRGNSSGNLFTVPKKFDLKMYQALGSTLDDTRISLYQALVPVLEPKLDRIVLNSIKPGDQIFLYKNPVSIDPYQNHDIILFIAGQITVTHLLTVFRLDFEPKLLVTPIYLQQGSFMDRYDICQYYTDDQRAEVFETEKIEAMVLKRFSV